MTARSRSLAPAVALLTAAALGVAACGGADDTGDPDEAASGAATDAAAGGDGELTPVSLQLQWFAQAQFAGYYAALEEGFYEEEGLDVSILEGAVDIVPQQVVATGGADFGIAWVPKALVSNTEGAGLVNVAQVFQRSGTLMVSWADSGITEPADWAGKTVGNWGFGNEYELTAAIEQEGVEDVELVAQNFDMEGLLSRDLDAAEAMIYNEYAQLLEAVNPDTGELYQPEDFTVIDFNDVGTAMLQDSLWVTEDYAAENGETIEAFLRGTFRGWIFCRDNPDACVEHVLAAGPTLGTSHQTWQMNEVNALIWPSPGGIGVMDESQWEQTVQVATSQIPELEGAEVDDSAYDSSFAESAVAELEEEGLDVTGEGFEKTEVQLEEGGV
ncbi:ABC transporter substrate-binding protein [Aquipuribacter nitratireducens]|uniref:Thiamine pyrimidine synthase n=1 Tax=Aquipuribacter nitratireducens TaxID=650104 RepID=A0ABW0GHC5_9MICO